MIAMCPNHQELRVGGRFITYKSWRLCGTPGATWRDCGGQGKKKASLGYCFYWGQEWGLRVSQAHSLLVNLKHMSRNLKCLEMKKQQPQGSVTEIKQDL